MLVVPDRVPTGAFFTKGMGVHKERLASFEMALRDAGIEHQNLVYVSSIFPPHCRLLTRKQGLAHLPPGRVTYVVLSRNDTDEPGRVVTAAVGLARPRDVTRYGYISEHHAYGLTVRAAGDYAEDLAATMLGSTLGIEVDPDLAWNEREEAYKMSGQMVDSKSIVQSAKGNAKGHWTTVLTAAVLLV